MKEIILFTTRKCINCPKAKSWANLNLKSYEIIEVDTNAEGMKLAKSLGVRQAPTFAIGELTYTFNEFKEMWCK